MSTSGRDPRTDVLARSLVAGPFHVALRAAIEARGLSLHRLHARLAERGHSVGVATLSYWQQGARRPTREESLSALQALEEILGLPPRSLLVLLGPVRPATAPVRRPDGPDDYQTLVHDGATLARMLHALGHDADGRMDALTFVERVRIGERGELAGRRTLNVARANGAVDRVVVIHYGEPRCDVGDVVVHGLSGCRTGRVLRDQRAALVVAELLFDRQLQVGDTHIYEYDLQDPSAVRSDGYSRFTRRPIGQLVLEVSFAGPVVPVRFHRYTQRHATAPRLERVELFATGHRTVHTVEPDVRPGVVGIDWEWD